MGEDRSGTCPARFVLSSRAAARTGWDLLGFPDPPARLEEAGLGQDLQDRQEHKVTQEQPDPPDLPALRARTAALEALVQLGRLDPPALAVLLGLKGPQDLPGLRARLAAVGQLAQPDLLALPARLGPRE